MQTHIDTHTPTFTHTCTHTQQGYLNSKFYHIGNMHTFAFLHFHPCTWTGTHTLAETFSHNPIRSHFQSHSQLTHNWNANHIYLQWGLHSKWLIDFYLTHANSDIYKNTHRYTHKYIYTNHTHTHTCHGCASWKTQGAAGKKPNHTTLTSDVTPQWPCT